MRARDLILATIVSIVANSAAWAQPPAPYGAWRGKIRYVEGPFKTRTHVRWGGGLTPVGGQVLMHLGTVAGDVATSPNFWSGLAGAPQPPRDAEPSPLLVQTVADVQAQNPALFAALNGVRRDLGLPPLTPPAAMPVPGPGPGPGPQPDGGPGADVMTRFDQWQQQLAEIDQRRQRIGQQVDIGLKIAEMLGADGDAAKVMSLQHVKTRAVVRDFVSPVGAVEATPAAFEAAYEQVAAGIGQLIPLLESCIQQGDALLREDPSLARPDRVAKLDDCRRWLEECRSVRL